MSAAKVGAVFSGVALLMGGVIGWANLAGLALELRIALAILAATAFLLAVALIFDPVSRDARPTPRAVASLTVALLLALVTVWFLRISTSFHSLVVVDQGCATTPGWECLELRPPRTPVRLDWEVAIRNRAANPRAEWFGAFVPPHSQASDATQPRVTDQEVTIRLTDFVTPDRYRLAYRLDGPPGPVVEDVVGLRPTVSVVHSERLARLYRYYWLAGGAWCLLSAALLFYSRRWVSLFISPPKDPSSDGDTLG